MDVEFVITGGPGILLDYGIATYEEVESKVEKFLALEKYSVDALTVFSEDGTYTTGK